MLRFTILRNEIITAASDVAEKVTRNSMFTPYPMHGMDDAMGMKLERWICFFALVNRNVSALLMIWWMSSVNYQNIIGGKPFFSLPSIPITFEGTVLLTGIATVLGMLILFNKLPKINSPLNDTDFMKEFLPINSVLL